MKEHLKKIDEEHDNIKICVVYSRPREGEDVEGVDYKYQGRVGADLFERYCRRITTIITSAVSPPMMNSFSRGYESGMFLRKKYTTRRSGLQRFPKRKMLTRQARKRHLPYLMRQKP